uniref:Uncharacterized protein n=1 Tax=Plectus sambesii TaxID=2011161 RepID=A0A914XP19_9BILA
MIPEMPMPDEYADLHLFSVRKIFDTYRPGVMVRDLLHKSQSASSFASLAHFDVADYVKSQRLSKITSSSSSSQSSRRLHQMTSSRHSTASNVSSSLIASLHGSLTNAVRILSLSAVERLQPLPMVMYK